MPVLSRGTIRIDYTDEGQGQPVIAIHSSVSANRQWRTLTETLRDRYRVLAVNLFGYGETTPWPGTSPQSLYAQAQLIVALWEESRGRVHIVGTPLALQLHSRPRCCLGRRSELWFF